MQRLADGSTGVEAAAEALRAISREFHSKQVGGPARLHALWLCRVGRPACMSAAAAGVTTHSRPSPRVQRVMYTIMQSSKLGARAPALRQLVTRLNFNGFADRAASSRAGGGGPAAAQPAASPQAGVAVDS